MDDPNKERDSRLQTFETLRGSLEQKAAFIAEQSGAEGKRVSNEYLAKLQQPDATPATVVRATQEFVKRYSPLEVAGNFDTAGGAVYDTLQAMESETNAFASKNNIQADRKASVEPTTAHPTGPALRSSPKSP